MKFTTAALASTMLATGAFAAPRAGLAERLQSRGVLSRNSLPAEKHGVLLKDDSSASDVQYSKNWAGVVRESPPPSGTYTAVSATFTVPDPTPTDNSGNMQAASAWVGIDGDSYTQAILQTGIDVYIENGQKTYDAWYEWYPNPATNFPDFDIQAGDVIVAIVRSDSPSKGVAILENQSSGQTVSQTLSAPSTSATLGGQNAEWIVEDFNSGDSMVPLVNFGEVVFSGAQAEAGSGSFGVNDGEILDIQQNGKLLAKVDIDSDTQFTVSYQS